MPQTAQAPVKDVNLSPEEAEGLPESLKTNRSSAADRDHLSQVIRATTQVSTHLSEESISNRSGLPVAVGLSPALIVLRRSRCGRGTFNSRRVAVSTVESKSGQVSDQYQQMVSLASAYPVAAIGSSLNPLNPM